MPALRETIQLWKPNLIIRESMEFAAVIAAAEADIPIVRVAVTNAEFEARVLRGALGPVDVLRQEAGLHPVSLLDQKRGYLPERFMINEPVRHWILQDPDARKSVSLSEGVVVPFSHC